MYTPLDAPMTDEDYLERVGLPGEPPFTRGVTPGCIASDCG